MGWASSCSSQVSCCQPMLVKTLEVLGEEVGLGGCLGLGVTLWCSPHPPQAPRRARKRAEGGATSNVFSMFDQSQIQEFKEVHSCPRGLRSPWATMAAGPKPGGIDGCLGGLQCAGHSRCSERWRGEGRAKPEAGWTLGLWVAGGTAWGAHFPISARPSPSWTRTGTVSSTRRICGTLLLRSVGVGQLGTPRAWGAWDRPGWGGCA